VSSSVRMRRWMRERNLASDARAGSWARAEVRRRQQAFVRNNWRLLLAMVIVAAAVTTGLSYVAPNRFIQGLTVGGMGVLTFGGIGVLVLLITGTAPSGMGATAEQWTASELRPLRKAGGRVVNSLALRCWDIDHVVILPRGVFAVESKWSGKGWSLDPPSRQLAAAIEQVTRNARDLRMWKPVKDSDVEIQPVLFLWGGTGITKQTLPRRIDGVDVVYGLEASRSWRSTVSRSEIEPAMDPDTINDLWLAMSSHIDKRDAYDADRDPFPPTLSKIYWTAMLAGFLAVGGFILCLKAFLLIHPWPWFALVTFGALAGGLAVRRFAPTRIAGLAWLVGVLSAVGLIAVAPLIDRIH